MESEIETEKRIREYWAKAHDANAKNKNASIYNLSSLDFTKNNDDELPFERTAVLAKAPPNQPPRKRSSIYNVSSLDFTT